MEHLKIFINLTRLTKPIGILLLFWPCSWGLTYAFSVNQNKEIYYYYLLLFFLGSVLMRSAGCIVNDIVDKDFDKNVSRTRFRPLASGKISVSKSLIYALVLCVIAFLILIQFFNNYSRHWINVFGLLLSLYEKNYILASIISRVNF